MGKSPFKKTVEANRGTSIGFAVVFGIHLIALCVIIVATVINRQQKDIAAAYVGFSVASIIINLWVFILCNIGLYTSGFSAAVGAGMPRKTYLRNAGWINLIFAGALLGLSLCGSAVCLILVAGNPETAEKLSEIAGILLTTCAAQIVIHLLYAALGLTMGWLILRIGVKMAATSMGFLSLAIMFIGRWIDLFTSLPDEQKPLWIAVICASGLVLTAVLHVVGTGQLKRISI